MADQKQEKTTKMSENDEKRFKMAVNRLKIADQKQEKTTKMAENAEILFKMAKNGKNLLR